MSLIFVSLTNKTHIPLFSLQEPQNPAVGFLQKKKHKYLSASLPDLRIMTDFLSSPPLVFTEGFAQLSGVFLRRYHFKVMHSNVIQYFKFYRLCRSENGSKRGDLPGRGQWQTLVHTIMRILSGICCTSVRLQR